MTPNKTRKSRHSSDVILLGILAGAVGVILLLLVVWMANRRGGPSALNKFSVDWSLAPTWKTGSSQSQKPAQDKPRSLAVYIDVSEPMGGFLAPTTSPNEPSGFGSIVSQLPDELVSVAGGTTSSLQWFYVASGIDGPHGNPGLLRRGRFNGSETRLGSALEQIHRSLDHGEMEMAVLVTDLIDTEDLVGAMGAAKALNDWVHSSPFRTGEFGIGILGVRSTYWGVFGKCGSRQKAGCWFSEEAQKYHPLTRPMPRPFYILVLGRGLDDVDRLGTKLLEDARELNLDAHWELLSGSSRQQTFTSSCHAWRVEEHGRNTEQFALFRNNDRTFECRQGEVVELLCTLPKGIKLDSAKIDVPWPSVQARLRTGQVVLDVDCERLRSKPPEKDLVVTIEDEPQDGWSDTWKEWSAATDEREEDIGRTLRLESFIEKVWLRPDRIRITSGPILKRRLK